MELKHIDASKLDDRQFNAMSQMFRHSNGRSTIEEASSIVETSDAAKSLRDAEQIAAYQTKIIELEAKLAAKESA